MNPIKYDVVVLGGGASGMMAAVFAARSGAKVVLIEKNSRLGAKVRISGGGRCNILNAEFDSRVLLANYGKSAKFLHSAFAQFGAQDSVDFFTNLGLPIKVEARNRAFPVSDDANDVVRVLEGEMVKFGVEIVRSARIKSINKVGDKIESIVCTTGEYMGDSYVLATGGMSRPETGSTGDGFDWLADLGHKVNESNPSITPLALKNIWLKKVAGVVAKSARITFYADGKKAFRLDGDILFTHFGISGPLVLNNAYRVAELLAYSTVTASIDTLPDTDEKVLDTMIVDVLTENGTKQLKNVINFFCPLGVGPVVKELIGPMIDLERKCAEVGRSDRKVIVETLKGIAVEVERLMGMDRAVVADGGIDLSEIDTRTFRSKKIANLYVTGDLLDINRPSGGFSLQLCWTTGAIAGQNAVISRPLRGR